VAHPRIVPTTRATNATGIGPNFTENFQKKNFNSKEVF